MLFRLTLLPAGLPHDVGFGGAGELLRADWQGERVAFERFQLFDDDIWRYLWDGHLSAAGENPYRAAPTSVALDGLAEGHWEEIRENINYPSYPTVYPPLAQFVFWLAHGLAPGSVVAMKILIIGADLGAAVFLWLALGKMNLPREGVVLYAWNPLVVKVFAGSGHADAVAVLCLAALAYAVAARWRTMAAVALEMSILAKLLPVVIAPLVVRRIGWRNTLLCGGVVVAGYGLFAGAGVDVFSGLLAFSRYWQFNNLPNQMLGRVGSVVGLLLVVVWLAWNDDGGANSFFRGSSVALGMAVVLSSAVMPWYLTMVLPTAVLAGQSIWLWFSAFVCLSFHVMIDQRERTWVLAIEYLLFSVLLLQRAHLSGFLFRGAKL